MDKKISEILYHAVEFLSEYGQWFDFCEYLRNQGISSEIIAKAYNEASVKSGHVNPNLTSKDCE